MAVSLERGLEEGPIKCMVSHGLAKDRPRSLYGAQSCFCGDRVRDKGRLCPLFVGTFGVKQDPQIKHASTGFLVYSVPLGSCCYHAIFKCLLAAITMLLAEAAAAL